MIEDIRRKDNDELGNKNKGNHEGSFFTTQTTMEEGNEGRCAARTRAVDLVY